jgi:hypothetical protein
MENELIKDSKIVGYEGAWKSGKNGAHFGLMMPCRRQVERKHFQEVALKEPMESAEVVSLSET